MYQHPLVIKWRSRDKSELASAESGAHTFNAFEQEHWKWVDFAQCPNLTAWAIESNCMFYTLPSLIVEVINTWHIKGLLHLFRMNSRLIIFLEHLDPMRQFVYHEWSSTLPVSMMFTLINVPHLSQVGWYMHCVLLNTSNICVFVLAWE